MRKVGGNTQQPPKSQTPPGGQPIGTNSNSKVKSQVPRSETSPDPTKK